MYSDDDVRGLFAVSPTVLAATDDDDDDDADDEGGDEQWVALVVWSLANGIGLGLVLVDWRGFGSGSGFGRSPMGVSLIILNFGRPPLVPKGLSLAAAAAAATGWSSAASYDGRRWRSQFGLVGSFG